MTQSRKQIVKQELKKKRRRRVITTTIIFVALAAAGVVGVILLQQQPPPNTQLVGTTIPNSLYANLAGVSNTTLSSVGSGGASRWTQIGAQLDTPSSAVARSIDGAANRLITALCKIDGGVPSSVCSQSYANLTQVPITPSQLPPAQFNSMIAADQIETRVLGKAH